MVTAAVFSTIPARLPASSFMMMSTLLPARLHHWRLNTDAYLADHGWTPGWTRPDHLIDWWFRIMDCVTHAGHNERANQIDFDDEVSFRAERHIPFDQCDPHSKRLRHACRMGETEMDEADIRNARHAYYGQIIYLDDKIGRTLGAFLGSDTWARIAAQEGVASGINRTG
ncbi:MAG: hypothetical protein ACOCWR_06720 [Oceanidesulfovibrio sp.]